MLYSRRAIFRSSAASSVTAALVQSAAAPMVVENPNPERRRFRYVQVDVFTTERLRGNPLVVFTDARGMSETEMQDLARETNLQETTFVFPRDSQIEASHGIKVRIFTPTEELPFAGHPTLGTATVLRMKRAGSNAGQTAASTIVLDLKVGKVPVSFHATTRGIFGEMKQVDPVFGQVHDRNRVAQILGLDIAELEPDLPIQTVSTGLPFAIVPIRHLSTLGALQVDFRRLHEYLKTEAANGTYDFYYLTRDTGDRQARIRARSLDTLGEDPATGSAAGCAAAWMVKYGIAEPDESVLIRQGIEMKRPSELFVRAGKNADRISNVRVGGYAVPVMEGTASL